MVARISTFLLAVGINVIMNHHLAAQERKDTVNKVINRQIPIASNNTFSVVAEKASVQITGWTKKHIQLKITFAAFHPEKEIATRELEFMQYALSRDKTTTELRNTFILPTNTDYIQSKLEVRIELMIPDGTDLALTNRYGDTDISRFTGKVSATMEFSDLNISNVHGQFILSSAYSEIRSQNMSVSSFTSTDEKSRINMDISTGAYTFNSKHSDINLMLNDITALTVKAQRTNITVMPSNYDQYAYHLVSTEGEIYVPARDASQVKKSGRQNVFRLNPAPAKPFIDIITTFNSITIK